MRKTKTNRDARWVMEKKFLVHLVEEFTNPLTDLELPACRTIAGTVDEVSDEVLKDFVRLYEEFDPQYGVRARCDTAEEYCRAYVAEWKEFEADSPKDEGNVDHA